MSGFGRLRGGLVVAALVVVTSLAWSATASPQVPFTDLAMDAIVKGPTKGSKTSKSLVAKVVNEGTSSSRVCDTDISWVITVNGTPTTGSVSEISTCTTLAPGSRVRFRATWTYGAGEPGAGATVVYTATVSVADDVNAANNIDTETRIAK